jgi:hypothetical protein
MAGRHSLSGSSGLRKEQIMLGVAAFRQKLGDERWGDLTWVERYTYVDPDGEGHEEVTWRALCDRCRFCTDPDYTKEEAQALALEHFWSGILWGGCEK